MRNTLRAIGIAVLSLIGAILLSLSATVSTSIQLMASYALKGAQVPVFNIESDQSIRALALLYGDGTNGVITPVPPVTGPVIVVPYPASWRPFSPGGLSSKSWDQSVREGVTDLQAITANDPSGVIFGYSQGAVTASEFKKAWNAQHAAPGTYPHPTFVLLGNGDRPNGGILARFAGLYIPGLDMTATAATPTDTSGAGDDEITTVDVAGQYDPIADAPLNPMNPFALANSAMGTLFVHLNYANIDPSKAVLQDTVGDTQYYLIPTYPVPLLMPVQVVPVIGPIAADMLDPIIRLLVETGYNRSTSPGEPTTADFGFFPNPITFVNNIPVAIKTGFDNGLQDVGVGRPLQTDRPDIGPGSNGQGAYGIGGPPVTNPTVTDLAEPPVTTSALTDPVAEVDSQHDLLQAPDLTSTNSNHFNVLRLPLNATPGQSDITGTTASRPKPAEAVKSVVSGVTQSVKAVSNAIKSVTSTLKPKKAARNESGDAP